MSISDVAIVGIGAIGCIVTANLARNNVRCHVIEKNEQTYDAVKRTGITISGVDGEYIVKKNIILVKSIEDLPKNINIFMIATKCNAVLNVAEKIRSTFKNDFTIILMTNGLIEEEAAMIHSNILSCSISFGATNMGKARSVKTSKGDIIIGRFAGVNGEIDDQILNLIKLIAPAKWSNNILGVKFSKLLINLSTASLGLISKLTLGDLLKREYTRLAFLILLSEGVNLSNNLGIQLEKINRFDFKTLALSKTDSLYEKKDSILKKIGENYLNLRSSSLDSLERGEETEIPFLNGFVVEKGRVQGVETPLNSYVVDICREIEEGKRRPSLKELEALEIESKKIWENSY